MINHSWDNELKDIIESPFFNELNFQLEELYKNKIIYPKKEDIFNALKLTPFNKVKVVILGQDPYLNEFQAHGLAFSINKECKIPPTLKNIFKELSSDLSIPTPKQGDLTSWAKEGVLLLNTILTVEKNKPLSHKYLKWEIFTNEIIKSINKKTTPVVFILWGNKAIEKKKLITNNIHLVLTSPHPSPSTPNDNFNNSKPFSKTNNFLIKNNIDPINWSIKP